ncbi:MAG: hypothetical protein JKY92_06980 [Magnetovibrio sp.]|nr:hypothetical protein [Magnetovibrio sp.]
MGQGSRVLFIVLIGAIVWGIVWAIIVFQPPSWLFPLVFVVIFLFYSNTLRERVPLYLSNRTTWAALSEVLKDEPVPKDVRPRFIDLGCGLGGAVAYLARSHPNWDVVGVETAPGPYLISKLRVAFLPNAAVRFQSLWAVDLGGFNMAYAFLSPAPMDRLCLKVDQQMPKGAFFISNSFWADGVAFDQEVFVNDRRESHLICKRL